MSDQHTPSPPPTEGGHPSPEVQAAIEALIAATERDRPAAQLRRLREVFGDELTRAASLLQAQMPPALFDQVIRAFDFAYEEGCRRTMRFVEQEFARTLAHFPGIAPAFDLLWRQHVTAGECHCEGVPPETPPLEGDPRDVTAAA
jgi:hypothetical protein